MDTTDTNIIETMIEAYERHSKTQNELIFAMNASLPSADAFKDSPLAKFKLHSLQRNILLNLRDRESMTVGEIAKAEATHQPAISKLVVSLEKMGLIRRFQKEEDFRRVYVELTEYAREVLKQQHEIERHYVLRHYCSVSSVKELNELADHFEACVDFFRRVKESQEKEAKLKRKTNRALPL